MKWRTEDGSTGRLLQYCAAYFFLYVITGVAVKYFQGPVDAGYPGFTSIQYLIFSTLSSAIVCLGVIVVLGWFRGTVKSEIPLIMISGVCTAVVIPTTTLMYTLPISVMVAMVIMRKRDRDQPFGGLDSWLSGNFKKRSVLAGKPGGSGRNNCRWTSSAFCQPWRLRFHP